MNLLPNKEFRYYLTYEGARKLLVFAPEDWDSDTIGQYKRDTYYGGVMRSLSLPLTFALDAYNILWSAFNKYSFAAEVIFEVEQLNHATFAYEPKFNSLLDFSTWDDNGIEATLTMLDNAVFSKIKAQETTEFEYELNGADIVNVILPGVAFAEKAGWINPQQTDNIRNDYIPAMNITVNDTEVGFLDVRNTSNEEDPNLATSTDYFAIANRNLTIRLFGNFQGTAVKLPLESSTSFKIDLVNQSGGGIYTFGIVDAISNGGTNFRFDFDESINIANGDKLFIVVRKTNAQSGNNNNFLTFFSDGEFNLSYDSVSDPSNCKGIKIFDLYQRIMRRIAPSSKVDSYLLKQTWIKDLILISGNAIRELEGATINISFKDFFDSCNAWESVGFGVEMDIYKIEQLPFFYRPTPILSTPLAVNACNFTTAADLVFSALEIGYNDGNTDDTDGQKEYNSKQEWEFPQSQIARKENWMSPIRADQYGIEKLRRDYIKKTNDTSSDNDTFAVHCELSGANWRPILGSSYVSVTGMGSELANQSSYNLALTPKENLLRHGRYIKSLFDKLENRFIEFGSAEKNKELTFVRAGNPDFRLKQNESIAIASLGEKYFKPVYATIVAKLPVNFMSLVDATGGFGYLDFVWYDKVYKGYIIEAETDLAMNTERTIKLLMLPDNYQAQPIPVPPTPLPQNRILEWELTESETTDVNLQIKQASDVIVDAFGNDSGQVNITEGRSVSAEAYSINGSTSGGSFYLRVIKDGLDIYNQNTEAVAGSSLVFLFTVEANSNYVVSSGIIL